MASRSLFFLCGFFMFLSFQVNKVQLLKTYLVTTIEGDPFVFKKQGIFYGYIPDVLQQAGRIINATFLISVTPDYRYGTFLDDGNWTGMVGQLVNNRSDIAAADLTITASRARAIHFSQPYFDTGLRILIKKPQKWQELETVMVILSPLKAEVWIIGLVLFVAVAVLLTVIGRFSPWEQMFIDGGTFDVASVGMTLHNSLLFTFGSLLMQGSRGAPRSISGRTLACFWWIFSVFFVIVYAANLTAFFLTKEPLQLSVPFETFDEMAKQSRVKFGFVQNGATYNYFKTSKQAADARIFQAVVADPSVLARSNAEGLHRVKNGNGAYAFVGESLGLEYEAARDCDLMVVGEFRDDRSYGFACRKDTTICRDLDVAILKLKEDGTLWDLYAKWFSGPCLSTEAKLKGATYADRAREGVGSLIDEKAVTLGRLGGPLVLLLIGVVLSLGILVGEVMWVKRYGEPQRPGVTDDERRIKDHMDLSS